MSKPLFDNAEQGLKHSQESTRKRAEALFRESKIDIDQMSAPEIQRMVNELQIHQLELELQNQELNRKQQELIASTDRYVRLYNYGTVAYLTLNQDSVISHLNRAVEKMLAHSKAQLIDTKFDRFIHPEDQGAFYKFIKNISSQNTSQILTLRLNIPNQSTHFLECPGFKLTDCSLTLCPHNNCFTYVECQHAVTCNEMRDLHICLAINNVTERIHAQESISCLNQKLEEKVLKQTNELIDSNLVLRQKLAELKKSKELLKEREAKLNSIFNASVDGIITIDSNGVIVTVNPAIESLFGYSQEELIGDNFCKLIVDPCFPKTAKTIKNFMQIQMPNLLGKVWEAEGLRKDGTSIAIDLSIATFSIDNHDYYTGMLRDISSRKEHERLEMLHLDELAHVTRLSLMGEMASGIAHEINQPLTAITNYADACLNLIRAKPINLEKLRETFIKIYQQALRAGQIINRMRDFVKFKATRRTTVEINKLIHSSVDLCAADLKLNAINPRLDLSQDALVVHVDSIQIEQVIINLIKNSIDALQEISSATPRQLSIQSRLINQNAIEIRVKDNGAGIDEHAQQNILMPFFTTKPNGMGMGLAISQSIIKSHGGTLRFSSKAGKGSAFYITLPLQ